MRVRKTERGRERDAEKDRGRGSLSIKRRREPDKERQKKKRQEETERKRMKNRGLCVLFLQQGFVGTLVAWGHSLDAVNRKFSSARVNTDATHVNVSPLRSQSPRLKPRAPTTNISFAVDWNRHPDTAAEPTP